MDRTAEFLIPPGLSRTGGPLLEALFHAALADGTKAVRTKQYAGQSDLLVLYGVGAPDRAAARAAHVKSGRHVVIWDLGYFGRRKLDGYLRTSIDHDHPQRYLDRTPAISTRWDTHGIALRDDGNPEGHIILVGLGRKSRSYLGLPEWEVEQYQQLQLRFPGRRIVYRPKPGHPSPEIDCERDEQSSIENLLRGAALVVCRHSNVAVDAAIAGVPFECIDGAAMWLREKPFTIQNRIDFLRRLAWWQWRADEAKDAWAFIKRMVA